jgi:hypothetical protein
MEVLMGYWVLEENLHDERLDGDYKEVEVILANDPDWQLCCDFREKAERRVEKLEELLTAINTAWNQKNHGQDTHSFHFWYSAHIEMIEALLGEHRNNTSVSKDGVSGEYSESDTLP